MTDHVNNDEKNFVSYEDRMASAKRELDIAKSYLSLEGDLKEGAGNAGRKSAEYIAMGFIEAFGFTLADVHYWSSAKEQKPFSPYIKPKFAVMVGFLTELNLISGNEATQFEPTRLIGNDFSHAAESNSLPDNLDIVLQRACSSADALFDDAIRKDPAVMKQGASAARRKVFADCFANSLQTQSVEGWIKRDEEELRVFNPVTAADLRKKEDLQKKIDDNKDKLRLHDSLYSAYLSKLTAEGLTPEVSETIKNVFDSYFKSQIDELNKKSKHLSRWSEQIANNKDYIARQDERFGSDAQNAEGEIVDLERKSRKVRQEIKEMVTSLKPKLDKMDAIFGAEASLDYRVKIAQAALWVSGDLASEINSGAASFYLDHKEGGHSSTSGCAGAFGILCLIIIAYCIFYWLFGGGSV